MPQVKPVTLSDSGGFIHCKEGFVQEQIDWIKELKDIRRGRISEAAKEFSNVAFTENSRPWGVAGDIAIPSATQNEISGQDAKVMISNGIQLVTKLPICHATKKLWTPS